MSPSPLRLQAEAVLLLADALGIPQFNWLGWSSGGNTGLVLAALYGDRLHRMASLAGMAGGPNTSELAGGLATKERGAQGAPHAATCP